MKTRKEARTVAKKYIIGFSSGLNNFFEVITTLLWSRCGAMVCPLAEIRIQNKCSFHNFENQKKTYYIIYGVKEEGIKGNIERGYELRLLRNASRVVRFSAASNRAVR